MLTFLSPPFTFASFDCNYAARPSLAFKSGTNLGFSVGLGVVVGLAVIAGVSGWWEPILRARTSATAAAAPAVEVREGGTVAGSGALAAPCASSTPSAPAASAAGAGAPAPAAPGLRNREARGLTVEAEFDCERLAEAGPADVPKSRPLKESLPVALGGVSGIAVASVGPNLAFVFVLLSEAPYYSKRLSVAAIAVVKVVKHILRAHSHRSSIRTNCLRLSPLQLSKA